MGKPEDAKQEKITIKLFPWKQKKYLGKALEIYIYLRHNFPEDVALNKILPI